MFFQILRSFKYLATRCARELFKWNVNANVTRYMIALSIVSIAPIPVTCQAQIVLTDPSHMIVAQVII